MKNYKTIQEVRDCDELSEVQKVQIEYYEDMYSLKEALEFNNGGYVHENVNVYEGQAIDYATEMFNEIYEIPECIANYIDYEAFCNDLTTGMDIYQFNDKYLITNASSI